MMKSSILTRFTSTQKFIIYNITIHKLITRFDDLLNNKEHSRETIHEVCAYLICFQGLINSLFPLIPTLKLSQIRVIVTFPASLATHNKLLLIGLDQTNNDNQWNKQESHNKRSQNNKSLQKIASIAGLNFACYGGLAATIYQTGGLKLP
jgi:hypothetical protein